MIDCNLYFKETQNIASLRNMFFAMFKGKYRIQSNRHYYWDYSSAGLYYVTICTATREHYFGSVEDSEIILTNIGQVALDCWLEIPKHFPFILLDDFVIMPNHIHGILNINEMVNCQKCIDESTPETQNIASLRGSCQYHGPNKFGPQSNNLGSIIRGYKTAVKSYSTKNNIDFAWQSRYYDHIIRDEDDLFRIRNYISNNPANWDKDEYM